MYRDDGPRTGTQHLRKTVQIEVESVWIDVHEFWCCSAIDDRVRRCDPGERGNDYLVPGTDAESGERQMQPGSARRDRHAVGRTVTRSEATLKFRDTWALCQPSTIERAP